jgi:hypothetical protein
MVGAEHGAYGGDIGGHGFMDYTSIKLIHISIKCVDYHMYNINFDRDRQREELRYKTRHKFSPIGSNGPTHPRTYGTHVATTLGRCAKLLHETQAAASPLYIMGTPASPPPTLNPLRLEPRAPVTTPQETIRPSKIHARLCGDYYFTSTASCARGCKETRDRGCI